MLLALQAYLPASQIMGAILVFRLFYYIIPLLLAGLMFAGMSCFCEASRLWFRPGRRRGGCGPVRSSGSRKRIFLWL